MDTLKERMISEKSNGVCWYCGRALTFDNSSRGYCFDHQTPESLGGRRTVENLVLCCRSCNSKKRNRNLEQYRQWYFAYVPTFSADQEEWLLEHGFNVRDVGEQEVREKHSYPLFYGEFCHLPEYIAWLKEDPRHT
jgi:hypothetical protein